MPPIEGALLKLFWGTCVISLILLYGSSVTKSIIFCLIDSSNLGFIPDPGLLSKLQFSLYLFSDNIMLILKLNQSNFLYQSYKLSILCPWTF